MPLVRLTPRVGPGGHGSDVMDRTHGSDRTCPFKMGGKNILSSENLTTCSHNFLNLRLSHLVSYTVNAGTRKQLPPISDKRNVVILAQKQQSELNQTELNYVEHACQMIKM